MAQIMGGRHGNERCKMQEVGAIAAADQPQVQIKPNGLLDYGVAAAVMASAQRHGVSKMGLVGSELHAR